MSESKDTREFCAELLRVNARFLALVGSKQQQNGWPDRYVSHAYWHGWIEFKNGKRKLDPLQIVRRNDMNSRQPGSCVMIRLYEDGRRCIFYYDQQFPFEGALECLEILRDLTARLRSTSQ